MTNMNGQSEAMPWKVLYFNIFIYLFLPKVYADMLVLLIFIFRGPSTNTCTLAPGRNWPRRHVSKYKMWRGEVEVIHHLVHIRFHWKDIGTVGRIWTWGF